MVGPCPRDTAVLLEGLHVCPLRSCRPWGAAAHLRLPKAEEGLLEEFLILESRCGVCACVRG